jgi:hypothetical protein
VLQQVSQMGSISPITFLSSERLDVLRVHQHQIETPFQDVPHGFPVNASCLHCHMGDLMLFKPRGHILKFSRERAKTTLQLLQRTVLTDDHACRNAFLCTSSPQHRE